MEIINTVDELEVALGQHIRNLRLQKNLDQNGLAERAGISVSALRRLERGAGATTTTLLSVVRALERQDWLATLAPVATINPLHMVRDKPRRQRASKRSK